MTDEDRDRPEHGWAHERWDYDRKNPPWTGVKALPEIGSTHWDETGDEMTTKTAENTTTMIVARSESDRLIDVLTRCAVALEALAADVQPPKPLAPVQRAAIVMDALLAAGVKVSEDDQRKIADALSGRSLLQKIAEDAAVAKKQTIAASSHAPLVAGEQDVKANQNAAWDAIAQSPAVHAEVAAELEASLKALESAKTLLGAPLYAAVFDKPLEALLDPKIATELKFQAVKLLGGEDAFAKARDQVGVKQGQLPTAGQARRLVFEYLLPIQAKNLAVVSRFEGADPWA